MGQLISNVLRIEVCFISPLISKIITGRKGFLFGAPSSREKNHHCSSDEEVEGGIGRASLLWFRRRGGRGGVCGDEPSPAHPDLRRRGEGCRLPIRHEEVEQRKGHTEEEEDASLLGR